MVTDKVLEIYRSNTHRPPVAMVAPKPDRPQTFILNQSAHGLLAYVQNIRPGHPRCAEHVQQLGGASPLSILMAEKD